MEPFAPFVNGFDMWAHIAVWCALVALTPAGHALVTPLDTFLMDASSCVRMTQGVVCSLSGDVQLASGSAVSGNVSVAGMGAAVLHLVPSDPLVLTPGSALSLSFLTVSNASFAGAPDLLSPLSVAFTQLSGLSVQPGSTLRLSNLSVQLDCADWASLFDVFCSQGYANGSVKVHPCSRLHVSFCMYFSHMYTCKVSLSCMSLSTHVTHERTCVGWP